MELFYILNCNIVDRLNAWITSGGTLLRNKRMGCGLNSLAFLNVITRETGEQLLNEIDLRTGTTMDQIMNLIKLKFHQQNQELITREYPISVNSLDNFHKFIANIKIELPNDSCTYAKMMPPFNFDPNPKKKFRGGHTILFCKDVQGYLSSIDPHQESGCYLNTPEEINNFFYNKVSSFYVYISLIYGRLVVPPVPTASFKSRKTRKSRK